MGFNSGLKGLIFKRLQDSETGHVDTNILSFPLFQPNAEMVPKTPSCYCMLLIQPSPFKFICIKPPDVKFKIIYLNFKIMRFSRKEE
jgi:hypothetical protein